MDPIFDFNNLGLHDSIYIDQSRLEEMEHIIDMFDDFEDAIDKKIEINLHRDLYGNLTEEEAKKVLSKYKTVYEGMKHIPGIPSDRKYKKNQMIIIEAFLEKIKELKKYGEEKKLFKADYKQIKTRILKKLFQQFGCYLDLDSFYYSVTILKKTKMIPASLTDVEITQYCPIGRWF
jgi:hypothetical protein